jgi:hypothetical protein
MTAAATVVETRKVVIHLAALTRVEYTEVLEVPADLDDDQLEALVDARSEEVDAGKFSKDPEYWEAEICRWEEADDNNGEVDAVVSLDANGGFEVSSAEELGCFASPDLT